MATPGSWIGKTPASVSMKTETATSEISKSEDSMSSVIERIEKKYAESDAKQIIPKVRNANRNPHRKQSESSPKVKVLKSRQVSKEVSENIRPSRPKKTESASRSNESSSAEAARQDEPKKKVYIRKPHLTDRPLADNEALKALRDSLPEAEKFNPGKKPRNKENN